MFRKLAILVLICISTNNILAKEKNDVDKSVAAKKSTSFYMDQFQKIFEKVESDYIKDSNKQEMLDEAIDGMLRSLDPYCGYYTDEDLEFFLSQTDGKFGGIGVEIIYERGAVKVITPIDDLPAFEAGIQAGDLIIGINGELVSNLGFNKSVKAMRGKPGTKLNLLVFKEEEQKTKEIELIRKIVKITPVKYEIEEEDSGGIAYIRLVAFNNSTTANLKSSMRKIEQELAKKSKKLKGIILDLRNNPGGLLDKSVEVSEYFIKEGIIVSVKGKENKIITASSFAQKAPNVPLVVLINSGTASAAEILTGALQDHKRAVIVGTTSFGKGLVQTFTPVSNRAAVKLTTAKYYTPSGRSINAKGIKPDLYIKSEKIEYEDKDNKEAAFTTSSIKTYLKKYNSEEKIEKITEKTSKKDKKERIMSDKYKSDYQYARAYDLIRGLIISWRD